MIFVEFMPGLFGARDCLTARLCCQFPFGDVLGLGKIGLAVGIQETGVSRVAIVERTGGIGQHLRFNSERCRPRETAHVGRRILDAQRKRLIAFVDQADTIVEDVINLVPRDTHLVFIGCYGNIFFHHRNWTIKPHKVEVQIGLDDFRFGGPLAFFLLGHIFYRRDVFEENIAITQSFEKRFAIIRSVPKVKQRIARILTTHRFPESGSVREICRTVAIVPDFIADIHTGVRTDLARFGDIPIECAQVVERRGPVIKSDLDRGDVIRHYVQIVT